MTDLLTLQVPMWMLLLWAFFMAAVQSLPRPVDTTAAWYVWLYGTLHLLSVNLKLALNPRNKKEE